MSSNHGLYVVLSQWPACSEQSSPSLANYTSDSDSPFSKPLASASCHHHRRRYLRREHLHAPGEQVRGRPGRLAAQEHSARPQHFRGTPVVCGHLLEEAVLCGAGQAAGSPPRAQLQPACRRQRTSLQGTAPPPPRRTRRKMQRHGRMRAQENSHSSPL
jgi:hypothetical protein